MIDFIRKEHYTADDLVMILQILRDPQNGCPWDKVQTHMSIRMNFLEEAYEAVDALDAGDPELLCEELGDVLMQVAFHAEMEQETGNFTWQDVCDGVCRKLIYRHPHIFGATPGTEGINDWDSLKNKEKGRVTLADELNSVPRAMPALMRAAKLQKRADRCLGSQPVDCNTMEAAIRQLSVPDPDPRDAEQALGRLLFETVRLARAAGLDPEQALERYNLQFVQEHCGLDNTD